MGTAIEKTPSMTGKQLSIITRKTPKEFIKNRPGRGGLNLSYVEVGYVISTLNEAFGPAWDYEIVEQQVGKKQVWVKGRLTVHYSPEFKFTKMAFGGAEIKLYQQSGEPIDIGDDLKAASADCLKKCASYLGLASDVYFPQLDRLEDALNNQEVKEEKSYP